jgi:hypothetical protein
LVGVRFPDESPLQGLIGTQPGVDFTQSMGASENRDQSILQFVERLVLDLLLRDLHLLSDGRE